MLTTRKMIRIDEDKCTGCGQCVPSCEEGALQIIDGKARLVKEIYCDGLGACLGECPEGALTVEVRQAEDFNPAAVADHLRKQGREVPDHMPDPATLRMDGSAPGRPKGGCPGAALKTMTPCEQANVPAAQASTLSHWPVQLRLVPPEAPFLRGADLLLTADCVAVALPGYHAEFVPGKVVLMGCPKFDNQMEYMEKLAAIIGMNDIGSITVMEMEVPCCSSMTAILNEAVKRAGKSVPTERVTVGRAGGILARIPLQFEH